MEASQESCLPRDRVNGHCCLYSRQPQASSASRLEIDSRGGQVTKSLSAGTPDLLPCKRDAPSLSGPEPVSRRRGSRKSDRVFRLRRVLRQILPEPKGRSRFALATACEENVRERTNMPGVPRPIYCPPCAPFVAECSSDSCYRLVPSERILRSMSTARLASARAALPNLLALSAIFMRRSSASIRREAGCFGLSLVLTHWRMKAAA
jgi:hypothetical protein